MKRKFHCSLGMWTGRPGASHWKFSNCRKRTPIKRAPKSIRMASSGVKTLESWSFWRIPWTEKPLDFLGLAVLAFFGGLRLEEAKSVFLYFKIAQDQDRSKNRL